MMITEYNYEEYFLLYVDDELTGAERSDVEVFIKEHPQYAVLLTTLLQTKLSQESDILFDNKNELLKSGNEIGIDNYEDYFLLYTDEELNGDDKQRTERFVLQHPQLQSEFTLLQQTKLSPDIIEYKGKSDLYKEEKKRRVLPLYFARISVAAALIVAVFFTWQLLSDNNNNATQTASIKTPDSHTTHANHQAKILPVQPVIASQQQASDSLTVMAQKTKTESHNEDVAPIIKTSQAKIDQNSANQEAAIIPVRHDTQKTVAAPETTEVALHKQTAVEIADNNKPEKVAVLKPLEEVNTEDISTQTAMLVSDDNATAQPAVYKELQTDDDSHTLYVSSFRFNKAKVNGFLKSASHLLGNRAKQTAE